MNEWVLCTKKVEDGSYVVTHINTSIYSQKVRAYLLKRLKIGQINETTLDVALTNSLKKFLIFLLQWLNFFYFIF